MTVETTVSRAQYGTNGTTGPWTVPFPFLRDEDLQVIYTDADGNETELALNVGYTVTGGGGSTGTVTTAAAYASGGYVTILRDVEPLQSSDYVDGEDFPAETVERDFDRLMMLVQQLLEITGRALVFSPSDISGSTLPPAAARASRLLGFDSSGVLNLNVPADGSAASLALLLAATSSASKGDAMIGVKYETPNAAALNLHSYIEDDGAYNVMGFIADASKAAIRDYTSNVDLDTQIGDAIAAAYADGHGVRFPRGRFNINAGVAQLIDGGRLDRGLVISGAGKNATVLRQTGTPGSNGLLRFHGSTPGSGTPNSMQMMMRDLSFIGTGKNSDGLVLDGIAEFYIDNVAIEGFDNGLDLRSTLIGEVTRSVLTGNNVGCRTRRNGTAAYCNRILFQANSIKGNSRFGLDFGAANGIDLFSNDIEENGVNASTSTVTITNGTPAVVTWAAHGLEAGDPVIFTTTGSLPTGIVADYPYHVIATGLTANTSQFSATLGGSAVATSSAGSGTHTARSPKTGSIIIRATCIDELGYAIFDIAGGWQEGNLGGVVRAEYMSSAYGLKLSARNINFAGAVGGTDSLIVANAYFVSLRDVVAVVGSDTVTINAQGLTIEDSLLTNLKRPTNTPTTVINSRFGGATYSSGENGSFTATLTGCTTSPTATFSYTIQGRTVTLNFAALTATSNSTAATVTGLPSILWPLTARTVIGFISDNGTKKVSPLTVGVDGVITLTNNGDVFTAAGTKGVQSAFTVTYEI